MKKLYYFLKTNYTEKEEDIEYIYSETEDEALDKGAQKFGYNDYNHLCEDVSDDISYTCGVVDILDLRSDVRNKLGSLHTTNQILKLILNEEEDLEKMKELLIKSVETNKESIEYLKNLGL